MTPMAERVHSVPVWSCLSGVIYRDNISSDGIQASHERNITQHAETLQKPGQRQHQARTTPLAPSAPSPADWPKSPLRTQSRKFLCRRLPIPWIPSSSSSYFLLPSSVHEPFRRSGCDALVKVTKLPQRWQDSEGHVVSGTRLRFSGNPANLLDGGRYRQS